MTPTMPARLITTILILGLLAVALMALIALSIAGGPVPELR
jgi:hypothetical protein